MAKLRMALNDEFEYLENELFERGFKNAIKRFLRGEKNRLKARFQQGLIMCPMNIQLNPWERLKVYWSTLQVDKKLAKCRNPNLGLTTKARACEGEGQE